jgi:hypothetical protein
MYLKNRVNEINNLLVTDDIHNLTISETHSDNTFDDTEVAIHGYNIYRKDEGKIWRCCHFILRTTFLYSIKRIIFLT